MPRITVRGRVLGPDGKPIAKARLYWPRLLKADPQSPEDIDVAQQGTTDAKGSFRVELPRSRVRLALIAVADGYGLDWAELSDDKQSGEVTLRLVKEQTIHGRVLSTEGKPVAGARVV